MVTGLLLPPIAYENDPSRRVRPDRTQSLSTGNSDERIVPQLLRIGVGGEHRDRPPLPDAELPSLVKIDGDARHPLRNLIEDSDR